MSALPSKMEGLGAFVYGMVRMLRPNHALAVIMDREGRELMLYAGQALADNKLGGMNVVDLDEPHNLPHVVKLSGLAMRLLPVPADWTVPQQYDLDFLLTDNLEAIAQYRQRVRPNGYILGPIAALDEYNGLKIGNFMLWRQ